MFLNLFNNSILSSDKCKRKLPKDLEYCLEVACEGSQTLKFLEVVINLTDFTGTLTEVKLSRENVSIVMGVTLEDYLNMSKDEIHAIEQQFLLENYVLSLKFKRFNSTFSSIQVVNMTLENSISRF